MTKKLILERILPAVLLLIGVAAGNEEPRGSVKAINPSYEFNIVGLNEPVEHTFRFVNTGDTVLQITNVVVTSPLHFKSADSKVPPGEEGKISFFLGAPRIAGDYAGGVRVEFKNAEVEPLTFEVKGKLTPAIECQPMAAFYVATTRGESKTVTIDVINHEDEPLKLLGVDSTSTRFKVSTETVVDGKHYRLNLTMSGDGAPNPVAEKIVVATNSKRQPTLSILANTLIKERVYTFPNEVDFGALPLSDVKNTPRLAETLSQTLMIYRNKGTNDFEVTAVTDLPFVKLVIEPSDKKDRFKITAALMPAKVRGGSFSGSIRLKTNDPEFSELTVPIRGEIQSLN